MGAYLLWDGDALHFDAVLNESVTITATPTRHPVEEGAAITDHVQDDPDRVRLDVFVSGSPIADVNGVERLFDDEALAFDASVRALRKIADDAPASSDVEVVRGFLEVEAEARSLLACVESVALAVSSDGAEAAELFRSGGGRVALRKFEGMRARAREAARAWASSQS
jgi:hypothetical protein